MKNLKTLVKVSCNLQGKATPTTAKVIGILGEKRIKSDGIKVSFEYKTENDEPILIDSTSYSWDEVNALWDVIKINVPLTAKFEELLDVAFLEAFKIEMASVYNISTTDIEEI